MAKLARLNSFTLAIITACFSLLAADRGCSASTLPPRKPGLWQSTMNMHMAMAGQTETPDHTMMSYMCIDPTTDMKMMNNAQMRHNCPPPIITGSGSTYSVDMSCKMPDGNTMTTHGTLVYIGDTQTHMEMTIKDSKMNNTMVQDSKWTGACPAGVMPGDIGTLQNGSFQKMMNVNDPH